MSGYSSGATVAPANAYDAARGSLLFERTVASVVVDVAGVTQLHLDTALTMTIRAELGGGWVFPAVSHTAGAFPFEAREPGARVRHVGVEGLALEAAYTVGEEDSDESHAWQGLTFDNVRHGFARRLACRHFGFACVNVMRGAIHVTVEDCSSKRPVSKIGGGRRYSFNVDGSLVLMQRLFAEYGRHDFVSGSRVVGPNVWRDSTATNAYSELGPHHRFSSGQLYDGITASADAGVRFAVYNRGPMGSGHGWTGTGVVYFNCASVCTGTRCTEGFMVDSPPEDSGINWAIGCVADSKVPAVLYRSGYHGNSYALTAPCAADSSDRPYQCCVASRQPKVGGEAFSPGGHWQSNGEHVTTVPSLYLAQLSERTASAPPPTTTPIVTTNHPTDRSDECTSCAAIFDRRGLRGKPKCRIRANVPVASVPCR
jgi:hypothetical protein